MNIAKTLAWIVFVLLNLVLFLLPYGAWLIYDTLHLLPAVATIIFYLVYLPLTIFCISIIVYLDLRIKQKGIRNFIEVMTKHACSGEKESE